MINIGTIDRAVRAITGLGLLALAFVPALAGLISGLGDWKYALAAVGAVLLGTAAFKICPAYYLFGIRTCEISKK